MSSFSKISVVSWNVLADCYAFGQKGLTTTRQETLLWEKRFEYISKCLITDKSDLICLQEVDHYDDFSLLFKKEGYESIYQQRPQRQDGCLIGYRSSDFKLEAVESVFFDNMTRWSGEGVRSHYERQNIALLAKFSCRNDHHQKFILTTAHLYWNPSKGDVKLAQTKHLLNRIYEFKGNENLPVIVTGDFNSLPGSEPYAVLCRSMFDSAAPSSYCESFAAATSGDYLYGPDTKFMCDQSLSRLCRWMRVLGIDAALETAEMKQVRTQPVNVLNSVKTRSKQDYSFFFEKATRERRVILTSSRQMRARASCPQSMLIPSTKLNNLELALIDICLEFGLQLDPEKFLTVCGKCGSDIESCEPEDARLSGRDIPRDRPVFICRNCGQPYWWNDRENSSPARAMKMADKLYSTIKSAVNSGGGKLYSFEAEAVVGIAEDVSILERATTVDTADVTVRDVGELSAKFVARDEYISSKSYESQIPLVASSQTPEAQAYQPLNLQSAFVQANGEEPELTNWNGDFMGTLDYIFVSNDFTKVLSAEVIPEVRRDLAEVEGASMSDEEFEDNGHLHIKIHQRAITGPQPSRHWPSDHLMLRVLLALSFQDATT